MIVKFSDIRKKLIESQYTDIEREILKLKETELGELEKNFYEVMESNDGNEDVEVNEFDIEKLLGISEKQIQQVELIQEETLEKDIIKIIELVEKEHLESILKNNPKNPK